MGCVGGDAASTFHHLACVRELRCAVRRSGLAKQGSPQYLSPCFTSSSVGFSGTLPHTHDTTAGAHALTYQHFVLAHFEKSPQVSCPKAGSQSTTWTRRPRLFTTKAGLAWCVCVCVCVCVCTPHCEGLTFWGFPTLAVRTPLVVQRLLLQRKRSLRRPESLACFLPSSTQTNGSAFGGPCLR